MPADLPFPHRWRRDPGSGWGGAAQAVADSTRGYTLWIFDAGLACCAVECAAALARLPGRAEPEAGRDGVGAGADPGRGEGAGHVLLVAGTVTDKLAPLVRQAYEGLPEPKYVLSFGACSNSGGPYWDSYCVTKGVDQFVPVDVYVPGCPPRPEALLHGLDRLAAERLARRPAAVAAGPGSGPGAAR